MIGPVIDSSALAAKAALEILAEGDSGRLRQIDVLMIANQEIHRHVERKLSVVLERARIAENKFRHAAAFVVGVGPDMAAKSVIAVEAAVAQRRVCKNCVDERHESH